MSDEPLDRRVWVWVAAVVLLGITFLSLPRPDGNVIDHLHKEDGTIFLNDHLADPAGALTKTYTGYLHAVPRIITAGCAEMPPGAFAGCVTEASYLLRGGFVVVAFLVLVPLARTWRWALAGASLFLVVPVGQQEALGNLTNLRWFCDAAGVLMLVGAFPRWRSAIPIAVLAALCALSDPLAVLIAPLALWRLTAGSGWAARLVPGAYLSSAVLHWFVLDRGARDSGLWHLAQHWPDTLEQVLVRGGMVAQYGQNGTEVAIRIAGLPLALLALALPALVLVTGWRVVRRSALVSTLVMSLWALGLLVATISFADADDIAITEAWRVGQASRYSIISALLLGMVLVVCASHLWSLPSWRRWLAGLTTGVLVVAVLADFPGDSWNTHGPSWSSTIDDARKACAGGLDEVTVQITPTGVPMDWTAALSCGWLR